MRRGSKCRTAEMDYQDKSRVRKATSHSKDGLLYSQNPSRIRRMSK